MQLSASVSIDTALDRIFKPFKLTKHQIKVSELLLSGYTSAKIAETLNVTEKTIKFHLTTIYQKTGVAGRSEFLAKFIPEYTTMRITNQVETLLRNTEAALEASKAREADLKGQLFIANQSARTRSQIVTAFNGQLSLTLNQLLTALNLK